MTTGQRRRLPSFCWSQIHARMPHLPGIPKTHFKTRVRMHALAELFPFPELPGVGCLLMEGYSSAISRARDR